MKTLMLILLLAVAGLAHAQTTTLIGAGIRNGDFNDDTNTSDARTFGQTPFWQNVGGGPQSDNATRTNLSNTDGSRNAQLTQVTTIAHGQSTEHTMALGDKFTLSYSWRNALNWNLPTDRIRVTLYTTSDNTITGTPSIRAVTTSALGATVNTWQVEGPADVYTAVGADVGKTLFVKIENQNNGDGSSFARLDDFELTVTPLVVDPALLVDSGDFAFGDLFHVSGGATTTRTVTFRNSGATQNLTLDAISLTANDGDVYSISSAPSSGSVIAPGATFDVEITATGGGGHADFPGALTIDTTPDDQDSTFPISANISTSGDPLFIVGNPGFNDGLTAWTGDAVSSGGLSSSNGARVRGVGDDRNAPTSVFANNLSQAFTYQGSPNFTAKVSFAIPDFSLFIGFAPESSFYDRSFHLAIQADATLPGSDNFDDTDTANTIINLFYFADGVPLDVGAGFFLWDGSLNSGAGGFMRLAALGTLLPSTGFNLDGSPPTSLNTYELTIVGTNFGTGSASYDISISDPNATTVAATVPALTVYHGANPTSNIAKAVVLTTSDAALSQTNPTPDGAYQPTFWVDSVEVSLAASLPQALYKLISSPFLTKISDGQIKTTSFSIGNVGVGQDLSISAAVFGDPRFSLISPSLPVDIAPGEALEFVVQADMSGSTSAEDINTSLNLTTNDAITSAQSIDLRAQVLVDGKRVLVDYDDGIANGVHEASIHNGGFEDSAAGATFLMTDSWSSRFSPEGDSVQLTYDSSPFAIGNYGVASGFSGVGDRAQPFVVATLDEWTLEEGDSFTIGLTWRDGAEFVEGEIMQVIVEVVDGDGNPIADPINNAGGTQDRFSVFGLSLVALGAPQTDTFTTAAIPAGSPWIGGRPRFRFLKTGTRSSFVELDNVSVVGNLFSPPTGAISVTSVSYNPITKDVTLRWIDGGFGTYTIESDVDLDFTSGVNVYPLDGSEDTTTYPGEIEFIFNDSTATSTKHFWRVVGE